MKILIDPGHGRNTPGKCSPDGRFREYQYTREIAAAVVARLQALGHDAEVLVPEFEDIPLSERVRRVNAWCRRLGKDHVGLGTTRSRCSSQSVLKGGKQLSP